MHGEFLTFIKAKKGCQADKMGASTKLGTVPNYYVQTQEKSGIDALGMKIAKPKKYRLLHGRSRRRLLLPHPRWRNFR